MPDRLPWFPFYVDDFLNDEAVRIADLATRGAYICLLGYQWREGSIPADPRACARLVGAMWEDEKERAAVVAAMVFFVPAGEGRLANQRLNTIAEEQDETRKARSGAGLRSGAARRSNKTRTKREQNTNYSESESESEAETELDPELSLGGSPNSGDVPASPTSGAWEGGRAVALSVPPQPEYSPEQLARDWNTATSVVSLPQCRELNTARRRSAAQRIREHPGRHYWLDIIRRITESAFCTGSNERAWRADFDFLVRPGSSAKVLEGKYDNRASPVKQGKLARVMERNLQVVQELNRALGGTDGGAEPQTV